MRHLVGLRLAAIAAGCCLAFACSSGSSSSSGGSGGAGSGGAGSGGTPGADAGSDRYIDPATLTWRQAEMTNFTSYPDPGSAECIQFSGCKYEGMFAAFGNEVKSPQWVMDHNIAAVHEKDFDAYVLKTLRLRQGDKMIDVVVYDECADADCDGCCTRNANRNGGFLIDIEIATYMRLGVPEGPIEWACLDKDCP
jgi:hypothetical protein